MALDYTATSDRVAISPSTSINNLGTASFLVWANPDTISSERLYAKGSGLPLVAMNVLDSGGNYRLVIHVDRVTTDTDYHSANGFISTGSWQCMTATYDISASPAVHMYAGTLTSLLAESGSYSLNTDGSGAQRDDSAADANIGNRTGVNQAFDGRIAVFMMWNRVLTLGELQAQQFRPHKTSGCVIFTHLGFAGSASQTQPDWSGNGNNGTVTGATVAPHVPLPIFPFQTWMPYEVSAGLSVDASSVSLNATVDNVSVVPSAASTTLDSLLLQSLLQDLNVSAGVATLSLDTLSLDIAPDDLSVVAGAATLGVDSLLLQSLLGNVNVLAGAASVDTTTLALNIQAGDTTVAVGVATIDLNTLSMNIAVDETSIVAGAASQSLESLLIQSALGNVTISVPANIRLPDKIRLSRTNQIPISQLQL